jgi:hypothetical protein
MGAPEVAAAILASVPSAPLVPAIPARVAAPAIAPIATAGINVTSRWIGRVMDAAKFLRWLSEDPTRAGYIEFKQSRLNDLAKSLKGSVEIPGLEQVEEKGVRVR